MDLERVCKVLDIFRRYDPAAEFECINGKLNVQSSRTRITLLEPQCINGSDIREIEYFGWGWHEPTKSWSLSTWECNRK